MRCFPQLSEAVPIDIEICFKKQTKNTMRFPVSRACKIFASKMQLSEVRLVAVPELRNSVYCLLHPPPLSVTQICPANNVINQEKYPA